MTNWGELHAGDEIRGADGRAWTVTGRGAATTWLGTSTAPFRLRLRDREVNVRRGLCEPVDLVEQANHADTAAAWAALTAHFPRTTILEETLSDPFSAPAAVPARIKRDRYGRYLLPDPQTGEERAWTRVTTVARAIADEYALTKWKMRMVAKGLAARPDLVAGAAAADPTADKSTLDSIAEQAMERAGSSTGANLGTALHTFTQRLDRGEALASLGAPAPLDVDLAAYADALRVHRLRTRPEWVERIVVLPEYGVAGTLDRLVGQPPGVTKAEPIAVLDLKSGADLSYSGLEIAIQEAFYARASLMWDPATEAYEPMPEGVDRDRGLVLHLPVGRAHAQLYAVNLIEGWRYAQLALDVRAARSAGKGLMWLVEPSAEELAVHNVRRAASQQELAELWDRLHPRGLWTEEVNAAAAQRWEEINATTPVLTPAS